MPRRSRALGVLCVTLGATLLGSAFGFVNDADRDAGSCRRDEPTRLPSSEERQFLAGGGEERWRMLPELNDLAARMRWPAWEVTVMPGLLRETTPEEYEEGGEGVIVTARRNGTTTAGGVGRVGFARGGAALGGGGAASWWSSGRRSFKLSSARWIRAARTSLARLGGPRVIELELESPAFNELVPPFGANRHLVPIRNGFIRKPVLQPFSQGTRS